MEFWESFRWKEALLAVMTGNVIYFLLVEPRLPEKMQHQPFRLDAGLLIDFLLCAAVFVIILRVRARGTKK
jgi:hypothetical protein